MPSFKTLSGLKKHIRNSLKDVGVNDVGRTGEEYLKEETQNKVYSKPSEYNRSDDLLNSHDSKLDETSTETNTIISVFNNPDKMSSDSHLSWMEPYDSQNDFIAFWMNYGTNSRLYAQPETLYFEAMVRRLSKDLKKIIIKGLKKHGIDAK